MGARPSHPPCHLVTPAPHLVIPARAGIQGAALRVVGPITLSLSKGDRGESSPLLAKQRLHGRRASDCHPPVARIRTYALFCGRYSSQGTEVAMPRDGHSPGAAASERSVNASESRHRSRRRLRGRLPRHVPGPGDPRTGDAMPAHTRASRVLPRPGSPLVADAMPVDPTCKPRPGSWRSAGRTRPAGAHTGAVPSRVPAVPRKETCAQLSFPHLPRPGFPRKRESRAGQRGVPPTPLLPRNPPLQGRRASDRQTNKAPFCPLSSFKSRDKKTRNN